MGHHLLIYGKQWIRINDFSLMLLRYIFLESATELGLDELRSSIAAWEYITNGVWANIDLDALEGRSDLFITAVAKVRSFGDEIPLKYLEETVVRQGDMIWIAPQPTERVIELIEEVRKLVGAGVDGGSTSSL